MHLQPIAVAQNSGISSIIANWLAGLATEIDFDTVPSGTVINNEYRGVTIQAVAINGQLANSGNVFASNRYDTTDADSSPNVVTISQPPQIAGFDEVAGGIQVTFDNPQLYVSIDVHPIIGGMDRAGPITNIPYMQVFGVSIQLPQGKKLPPPLIATLTLPPFSANPNFESWQRLDFVSTSTAPNIGSIIFSSSHNGIGASVYALFDRLRFAKHLPISGAVLEG
jgi:hypothetical protein